MRAPIVRSDDRSLPIRLSPTPTICSVSPWTAGKGRRRRIEEAIRLKGLSLCFRSHQMLIGLLRSRHGSWTVPGDVRELLDLGKLVSSAVRQAEGPVFGPD